MTPTAYPLSWPAGKARTRADKRARGNFSASGRRVTYAAAAERLEAELSRFGAIYTLLSTDQETRRDGKPRQDRGGPADPGAAVYFQRAGKPYALACDTYDDLGQNIAALAEHVKATRAIERYGVATAAEMLRAFEALPSPDAPRPWWTVLGLTQTATAAEVQGAFRRLSAERHPDKPGGSHNMMAELTAARDAALRSTA